MENGGVAVRRAPGRCSVARQAPVEHTAAAAAAGGSGTGSEHARLPLPLTQVSRALEATPAAGVAALSPGVEGKTRCTAWDILVKGGLCAHYRAWPLGCAGPAQRCCTLHLCNVKTHFLL